MLRIIGASITTACLVLFAGVAMAQDACDTDYNGDGVTDASDVEIFQSALGSSEGDENYVAGADLDGDGTVTAADYGLFLSCN